MLPSNLLVHRQNGESVAPKHLPLDARHRDLALASIACFQAAVGNTQAALDAQLLDLEGDSPDYRLRRGLAHLLKNSFATFEVVSPLEPLLLRERVFAAAAERLPSRDRRDRTLEELSHALSRELGREVLPADIATGLYADLQANRILTQFDAPTPEGLLQRYNLAQVQGIFYRATHVAIDVHRNDPGEYKLLFRYLKLFQLMAYIEGDADCGFTIAIDGPASLFKASTRYGLSLAKLIPALLHVTRWSLKAELNRRNPFDGTRRQGYFQLDSDCSLTSHYPPGKPFDSLLEESFAKRWAKMKTPWQLEREVDLVPIPGSVMIPDFRLVHPDGRSFLLEIVGYWRLEYLRRKFAKVRRANIPNLVLAISERLNLEKAEINTAQLPARVVWFKDKLAPKAVLEAIASDRS
ncbi:hypothetical protein KR51_00019780 [Rubidibacter lacunae KORDI 51-2]|uniref:DUF790 family protein n=1 Tax=Rubidibacter lacunae KORDI 51-2 TaxID=582515 RepID=U5DLF5_9CHRO|nr:DUF790 family protein [Rubidibacter lacunae]ERN41409.1 hypothetical protein KR51_00019780 [Rubidibacter lacunae KORDI 51-2]